MPLSVDRFVVAGKWEPTSGVNFSYKGDRFVRVIDQYWVEVVPYREVRPLIILR